MYLDETKKLSEWVLIFWWIITFSDISHVNAKIWNITDDLGIEKWSEIKSVNQYGDLFYKKKWFQILLADMSYMICSSYITDYRKDVFETYIKWLSQILSVISSEFPSFEIELYIDDIKFWKNEKDFLKWIKKSNLKLKKCSIKTSKNHRSIQIADLVAGIMRKYYLFQEEIKLEEYFPLCRLIIDKPWKINTKKSPPEVTSTSALVARTP